MLGGREGHTFTTFTLETGCLEMTVEWFQKCLIQREMEMQIALYPGPSPIDLEPPPPSFLYKKKTAPSSVSLEGSNLC